MIRWPHERRILHRLIPFRLDGAPPVTQIRKCNTEQPIVTVRDLHHRKLITDDVPAPTVPQAEEAVVGSGRVRGQYLCDNLELVNLGEIAITRRGKSVRRTASVVFTLTLVCRISFSLRNVGASHINDTPQQQRLLVPYGPQRTETLRSFLRFGCAFLDHRHTGRFTARADLQIGA